ncbi:MAG: hypothetical protein AB1728_02035 [Bacteroidota bacterium]
MKRFLPVIGLALGTFLIMTFAVFVIPHESLWKDTNLSSYANVGDTIGGITAPIIGLLGVLLVYFSFKEQSRANDIQIKALNEETRRNINSQEFNVLLDLYKQIKSDYDSIYFSSKVAKITRPLHGRKAINSFTDKLKVYYKNAQFLANPFYRDYRFLVNELTMLVGRIKASNIDKKDSELLMSLISFFYETKMKSYHVRILDTVNAKKLKHQLFSQIRDLHNKMEQVDFTG